MPVLFTGTSEEYAIPCTSHERDSRSKRSQSNILISNHDPPRALLSDFGLTSIIFDPFSLTKASINWTAPELLSADNDRRGPSLTGDIYALAMVMYEVL